MSFKSVYLRGVKRTPYLGGYTPEVKEQAEWELLLYRSLLREGFEGTVPSLMLQSYPSNQRGAQVDFSKELFDSTPSLFTRIDAGPFNGVEALWVAAKQLESYSHFFLLGGGLGQDLWTGKEAFLKLSERISREELYERDALDTFTHEQIKKYEKASERGIFASSIMPVLQGKGFSKLLLNDLLTYRDFSIDDFKRLPALLDRVRGVVTQGNSAARVSAYAGLALSNEETNALLAIDEIKFFFFDQKTSWKYFVKDCLNKWKQVRHFNYSSFEFLEFSASQSLGLQTVLLEDMSAPAALVNPFGGALGRGVCPTIESWITLSHFINLYSEQKGLMIVPHPEGHLALVEVRKT